MNIKTLRDLLLDEGWHLVHESNEHGIFECGVRPEAPLFVMPLLNSGHVPNGTLHTILRLVYAKPTFGYRPTDCYKASSLPTMLEKQENIIWARVEMPGSLLLTFGQSVDYVTARLRGLLIDYINVKRPACSRWAETASLDPVYDLTDFRELIKEMKPACIADQTNIHVDLVNQFLAGETYPCPDHAARLEDHFRQLGRQFSQLSIR